MSVVTSDNFESYSTGALNGENGGTGWQGAWVTNDSSIAVQTSTVKSGSNAVESNNNASGSNCYRQFDSLSDGVFTIYVRNSNNTKGYGIWLASGGFTSSERACFIYFTGGDIKYQSNSSYYTLKSNFVSDTWYKIDIEFDCSTDEYRARVDDSSWTSWVDFAILSSATTLDYFKADRGSAGPYYTYIDDISIDATVAPTADISEVNGVTLANLSEINGVTKANASEINGLTTS